MLDSCLGLLAFSTEHPWSVSFAIPQTQPYFYPSPTPHPILPVAAYPWMCRSNKENVYGRFMET